jgi:signal transduction histidine kinase
MCTAIGHPPDQVVGMTIAEARLKSPRNAQRMAEIEREGQLGSVSREYRFGNRVIDARISIVTLTGERCLMCWFRDVTAVDRAMSEHEQLAGMFDSAPMGFVFYDRDLRVVRLNSIAEQTADLRIGTLLTELPGVSGESIQRFRAVLDPGEKFVDELMPGRDGRQYRVTMFPVRSEEDEIVGAGCIYVDVTEQFTAELALRASEHDRVQILTGILHVEELERARIATALHDDTVQVMTASLIALDRVGIAARRLGEASLDAAVTLARATIEEATERTRRLMFELRPAILHERGLLAAVQVLAEQTQRETGAATTVSGDSGRCSPVSEELAYRVIQEGLTNVRKHARAGNVSIDLSIRNGMIESEICDDGRGFDVAAARARPGAALHAGLDSLHERVRAAGGHVDVDSKPGGGTRLRFSVPTV